MKYVESLRVDKVRTIEWERQEELRRQREKAERIKKEWERRLNPKTKDDFDLLYSHLESTFNYLHFVIYFHILGFLCCTNV